MSGRPARGAAASWTLPVALLFLAAVEAPAQGTSFDFGGRATYQLLATYHPADSLLRDLTGSSALYR